MPGEEANSAQATREELRVLVVPATTADALAIRKVLKSAGFASLILPNVAALCDALKEGVGVAVISEEPLLADTAPLLEWLGVQEVWSDLPVIVLTRAGPEHPSLTQIVPRLGNVSLVERPVRTLTLVSLVRSSLRARMRQYQVRAHLAQQERAQRAIQEGEQRFRLIIENLTDYAIFLIDTQGCVASWNTGAEHMLGYTADEVLGQPAARFFLNDEGTAGVLRREMTEAEAAGRATSTGWRVRKDGARLFVEGLLIAVRDEHGEVLAFAKFMKNITEKHRIEGEREEALQSERVARSESERVSRMKDEFLATLGHELRTPLNAMLGWSQVLRRQPALTRPLLEGLDVIERNARMQAQIIEDLLDMSRIISGKIRLDVQQVDLASVVEAAVTAIRPTAQAKGIRLQVVLDPLARAVRGDPHRLQQIFWNLLTNALKFTPKDGRVAVTLERVNSHLEVSVSDSGEGIEPAFLPHVFERFRQADASTSRRHGGLGLGLSIVKQLVELHGGTVSAKSSGTGMGASFRVALPVMAANGFDAAEGEAREHPARSASADGNARLHAHLRGVKVLVVDDQPDARLLIRRLLEEQDATVITAASAAEALESVRQQTPDVLVSDIGMPREDGYSLIRRLRALGGEKGLVPAIALTAYARVEDRVKAIRAGYQSHLSKPVEAIELVAIITSLVKRPPMTAGTE
jgi:PAS domain S-box-containing protein